MAGIWILNMIINLDAEYKEYGSTDMSFYPLKAVTMKMAARDNWRWQYSEWDDWCISYDYKP